MMNNKPKEEKTYSNKDYVEIARDLCYPNDLIERIRNAQNELEAERLLAEGRHKMGN